MHWTYPPPFCAMVNREVMGPIKQLRTASTCPCAHVQVTPGKTWPGLACPGQAKPGLADWPGQAKPSLAKLGQLKLDQARPSLARLGH